MQSARGNFIVEQQRRETGQLIPRAFASRYGASEDLILRFSIHKKLDKHTDIVYTVRFNTDGDILISGGDDLDVVLWDWDAGLVKLSFDSGHEDNVLDACFMPFTNDRTIVTAGEDSEVRQTLISESGQVTTTLLAEHNAKVTKLAVEPGNPYVLYSCGHDGLVQHIDLRTKTVNKLFICNNTAMSVSLNSIVIDPRSPHQFAIGGEDEYIRVYDIRKLQSDHNYPINYYCPPHLVGYNRSTITDLAFSDESELLVSYRKEVYLFSKDQGLGPDAVNEALEDFFESASASAYPRPVAGDQIIGGPQEYKGYSNREEITSVSFIGPNCEYVSSSSNRGQIFIWRKRDGMLLRVLKGDKFVINRIAYHPYAAAIASCGIDNVVEIWTPNATEPVPAPAPAPPPAPAPAPTPPPAPAPAPAPPVNLEER